MKNQLFLITLFLFSISLAQENKYIKLNYNIKDPYSQTRTLTLLDLRTDKNIGKYTMPDAQTQTSIEFPQNTEIAFKDWFDKYNKTKGQEELVVIIKKLKVNETDSISNCYGFIDFDIATFLKKKDGYHFIYRYKNKYNVGKDALSTSNRFLSDITFILSNLINNSYKFFPRDIPVSSNELLEYEKTIVTSLPVFKNEKITDGIYKDSYSFFYQEPEKGNFQIKKNQEGNFSKATNLDNKQTITAREIFAYVENGKVFKKISDGFEILQKDEKGFYVFSNKFLVEPEIPNYGGSLTGVVLAQNAINKAKKEPKYNIYIDSLTGGYIFK